MFATAKEFPCWEKIKMIFPYLCFLFFWKQCFARFVCVVMRSPIAFLSLTIMKTVTLPILFSLPLLLLSHTFTSLLFSSLLSASDPLNLSSSFLFYHFSTLLFSFLIYFYNSLPLLILFSSSLFLPIF
ncbi:hypothetical protein VIGAN_03103300 [Vigna angularis var. angularis]|uniref:Uncharacterized protein n=1 Tax=Vigna angularis var. angularis TaxID=157739 RepID=A0A0S3RL45_PHAAN|nr:hypothetical protein VIGAN_03103300 [Vigna angularis var. angularis]